jgi:hypothetical protein
MVRLILMAVSPLAYRVIAASRHRSGAVYQHARTQSTFSGA